MKKSLEKEDIGHYLKNAKADDKAAVMLLLTTGMSISDLTSLRYINFLDSIMKYVKHLSSDDFSLSNIYHHLIDRDDIIGTWQVNSPDTGIRYITFCTPECTKAILNYLMEKEMNEGTIKPSNHLFRYAESHNFSKTIIETHLLNMSLIMGKLVNLENLRLLFIETLLDNGADLNQIKEFLGYREREKDENFSPENIAPIEAAYSEFVSCLTVGIEEEKIDIDSGSILANEIGEEWWDE